jgi:hypothetical protein
MRLWFDVDGSQPWKVYISFSDNVSSTDCVHSGKQAKQRQRNQKKWILHLLMRKKGNDHEGATNVQRVQGKPQKVQYGEPQNSHIEMT